MAEMLGRASKFGERSVRKDMARLVDAGLIRYQHRLGRRSNTYTFLFHGDFLVFVERNSSSAQIAGEGLPLQDLTGTPVPLSDHAQKFERNPSSAQTQNGADLNGTPVPLKSFEQSISGSLSGTPVPVGMRLSGTPVPPNQLLNLQEEHTDFDASEIFERIYKRHPKKVGKILAERAIASVIADSLNPKAVAAQIERSHAAHCRTPQWIEQGGRFAPKLERWILDRGFLDDLPTNEQSISEYPEL
jgi:hypothetical protein